MASSTSSLVQQKHQVFLSFRGEDTRNNFTSHLYAALKRKGINTFTDNQLTRGEEISPALLTAIEESKISIVVLSKNYASSSFCLDELSKILECKERNGQKVVPIFYHVHPSYVRNLKGSFAEAFVEHVKKGTNKVEGWTAALKKVADVAGHHLDAKKDRLESTVVEEVVKTISKELMRKSSYDTKSLVGIDSRIREIKSLLRIDSSDVQIIGICGIGGIGKTTIDEVVYNQFSAEFEGCCFLNVKDELNRGGVVHLLKKLLSKVLEDENLDIDTSSLRAPICDRLYQKKVLIVLDDVNNLEKLDLLREKLCFGLGSRIIITSREKRVLQQVVDVIYEVKGLTDDEALQLFSVYAFKQSRLKEDFMELLEKVVDYAKGLPLALRVVGSTLNGRSKSYWESYLSRLKEIPNPEIDDVLKISYDGLNGEEKNIFLDIACFFKGEDKDYVTKILGGCYSYIMLGIDDLINKSVITISDNKLEMHDLLQQMAWNIVRQESKSPSKRSRLWTPEDICHVLKNNMDAETIEGMFLDMSKIRKVCLSSTAFARMCNLRLLKFYFPGSCDHPDLKRERKVNISQQGLESLPDNLCYLHWDDYPSKSLPLNFCPENLVKLELYGSHVKRLWQGTQNLVNLIFLNLSNSEHLIKLPNLSQATKLERIILNGCTSLVKVPASIRYLNNLIELNLEACENLGNLPCINLRSLKRLYLFGCSKVTKFPEISKNLESLCLAKTAIEELPSSIECLSKLEFLYVKDCRRFKRLPSSICKLNSLQALHLDGCLKLKSFPKILETMKCLKFLSLSRTSIEELPSSIKHLVGLESLELNDCKKLKNLPSSIRKLKSLKYLELKNCSNFTKFQEIPRNIKTSDLGGTAIEQVSSSIKCDSKSLEDLRLRNKLFAFPSCLSCLSSLRHLDLSGDNFEIIPASIKQLFELRSLHLSYCKRLRSLPKLPPNLQHLNATSCTSLEAVSSSFTIPQFTEEGNFIFTNCVKLDQNAISQILVELRLSIQHMETKALKLYHEGKFSFHTRAICLPGSEIPDWFNCHSTGSSVTTRLAGFALCAVVGFALCAVVALEDYDDNKYFSVGCKYNLKTDNGDHHAGDRIFLTSKGSVDLDHIFLNCELCVPIHSNEASFEFYVSYWGSRTHCGKVKKCGIHLLYAQNDPKINQIHHDKVPRGNFKPDEVKEEPQPKRLKWNLAC